MYAGATASVNLGGKEASPGCAGHVQFHILSLVSPVRAQPLSFTEGLRAIKKFLQEFLSWRSGNESD